MGSKTIEQIIEHHLFLGKAVKAPERDIMKNAIKEYSSQQNATLIEQNRKLRNKLSELYEAYGSITDITPELLQSVAKTLKDTEDGK